MYLHERVGYNNPMPTPRDIAMKHAQTSGEPNYCGTCGLPGQMCDCKSYKEWGAEGATKAGSATADTGLPAKGGNGNGGNGNGGNGNGGGVQAPKTGNGNGGGFPPAKREE